MTINDPLKPKRYIEVSIDGPLVVHGDIPLVRKTQVVSECGEPIAWRKDGEIEVEGEYCLCRCGQSGEWPFCDGNHNEVEFDGTEKAPTNLSIQRRVESPPNKPLTYAFDLDLCTESGFCGNRNFSLLDMNAETNDIQMRTLAIHMIEHCPSGALTYRLAGVKDDIEVDLPQQIAVTTEVTSQGPVRGPLWVTGNIPVLRADGLPFETRNRVTLCSCGRSQTKPLCDGRHRG